MCSGYKTKQSDSEFPVILEHWGMQSTFSLPSLPGPLGPGVVVPDRVLLWYKHNDINNNSDTNTGGTNEFINFLFQSLTTQGEREIIKAFSNNTMLSPTPRAAYLVVFKIFAGRDPK